MEPRSFEIHFRKKAVIAFGMACIIVAGSFPASGALVVDQSFAPSPCGSALICEGSAYIGQSVTAGKDGYLARVDLGVYRQPDMVTPWEVTIHSVRNGVPTGTILATQVLPTSSALTPRLAFPGMTVNFDTPAYFHAGDQFAIVVRSPGVTAGAGHSIGYWGMGDDYPGGEDWASNDGRFFVSDDYDLLFVTYVATPWPCGSLLLILGAVAAIRKRRWPGAE